MPGGSQPICKASDAVCRRARLGYGSAMTSDPARNHWLVLVLVRLASAGGAVLGLLLLARSEQFEIKLLAVALILAALYVMGVVPLALARRWKTPDH